MDSLQHRVSTKLEGGRAEYLCKIDYALALPLRVVYFGEELSFLFLFADSEDAIQDFLSPLNVEALINPGLRLFVHRDELAFR